MRRFIVLLLLLAAWPVLASGQEVSERIIGGAPAIAGKYPFMTYLRFLDSACGGSLISSRYVLTAAHCTYDESGNDVPPSAYMVRVNSTNSNEGGQVVSVVRVIRHENYNRTSVENDIALLELNTSVETTYVPLESGSSTKIRDLSFAPVSTERPFGKIVGWGETRSKDYTSAGGQLMEADTPIIDANECNKVMGGMNPYGQIDNRRICAGKHEGGVDTCAGDSGGPLLAPGSAPNQYIQIGITSYGVADCGMPNKYGVYTRVAAFSDWITRNVVVEAAGANQRPPDLPGPAPIPLPSAAEGLFANAQLILAAADRNEGGIHITILPSAKLADGTNFTLKIQSKFDGYLLLLDVSQDGHITKLFPNERSLNSGQDGRILAGTPLVMPDESYGFAFHAGPPYGRGRLIAIVVRHQEMLGRLLRVDAGAHGPSDKLQRFVAVLKSQAENGSDDDRNSGISSDQWNAAVRDYEVEQ